MKLKINGTTYTNNQFSDNTQTLIQACETFGYSIPRFCYHQKLSIAGNCRMCLVEVENAIKPVASCAVVQAPNMSIFTDSAVTRKAREAVMEFLLLNHPLDCPICDQGGECDLQDQSLLFGNDRSRFYGYKRAVANKNIGPLVKMVMTRCIHCTRCVRFANDIAGVQDLGVTGRGSGMEIGTYIEKAMKSELSGNVIDLCPVGALTSKPYAFSARPWEVQSIDSIDTTDSIGSNITVQAIGAKIMRVLPKANDSINGDWITDKARFSYDSVTSSARELDTTLTLTSIPVSPKNSIWFSTDFIKSLSIFSRKSFDDSFKLALIGDGSDAEELIKFKTMYNRNYSVAVNAQPDLVPFFFSESLQSLSVNSDFRHFYRLNTFLTNLNKASFTLVLGSDLRTESPIIHSLISSRLRVGEFSVNYIGSFIDSKIGMSQLGNNLGQIYALLNGTSWICGPFLQSLYPSIIVGSSKSGYLSHSFFTKQLASLSVYTSLLKSSFQSKLNNVLWCGVGFLGHSANSYFTRDLHVFSKHNAMLSSISKKWFLESATVFSHRLDNPFESNVTKKEDGSLINTVKFVTHRDTCDVEANQLRIPLKTFFEKKGLFVNLEGRTQLTKPSVYAQGTLGTANPSDVYFSAISTVSSKMHVQDHIPPSSWTFEDVLIYKETLCPDLVGSVDYDLFNLSIKNCTTYQQNAHVFIWERDDFIVPGSRSFYMSDALSKNSVTMSKCEAGLVDTNFLKTPTSY